MARHGIMLISQAALLGIGAGCGARAHGSADTHARGDSGLAFDGSVDGGSGADSEANDRGSGADAGAPLPPTDVACPDGSLTTLRGTVYDPAGKSPIYNATVYVPPAGWTSRSFVAGPSCSCDVGEYIPCGSWATATDTSGRFAIHHAPDGTDVPLVVQKGHWRRQLTLPNVTACQDNQVPSELVRLPRNQSEGEIPSIAVATGGGDSLECVLRRIGVDASEFVAGPSGAGRIHVFQGTGGPTTSPPAPAASQGLWDSATDLMNYDLVLLSSEGGETQSPNRQALFDYVGAGGQVMASHYQYVWFDSGPFASENIATWTAGDHPLGSIRTVVPTTLPDGGTQLFEGPMMQSWLLAAGALETDGGLPAAHAWHNADVTAANAAQPLLVADPNGPSPNATELFVFSQPPTAAGLVCGGAVTYSDLAVGPDYVQASSASATPTGCADRDLSASEKALEFVLFGSRGGYCVSPCPVPPPPRPNG
jgi:hypothetical protein